MHAYAYGVRAIDHRSSYRKLLNYWILMIQVFSFKYKHHWLIKLFFRPGIGPKGNRALLLRSALTKWWWGVGSVGHVQTPMGLKHRPKGGEVYGRSVMCILTFTRYCISLVTFVTWYKSITCEDTHFHKILQKSCNLRYLVQLHHMWDVLNAVRQQFPLLRSSLSSHLLKSRWNSWNCEKTSWARFGRIW